MILTEETAAENTLSFSYRAVAMERTILFVFLYVAVEGKIGKHVFVGRAQTWSEAQAYCREHHTDLSYLNSQSDLDKLRKDTNGRLVGGWIGLQRDPNNKTAWKWSGGGRITYQNWNDGEPNNVDNANRGFLYPNGKWDDRPDRYSFSFYCVDVSVEEEEMSWEEALNYCRDKQTDLPSVISETDRLLVQTEIQNQNLSEPVWMGLRFLGDRWMWVNGDPLEYEAWSRQGGQNHRCPVRKRCGALTKDGLWENLDCQDKLHFICI